MVKANISYYFVVVCVCGVCVQSIASWKGLSFSFQKNNSCVKLIGQEKIDGRETNYCLWMHESLKIDAAWWQWKGGVEEQDWVGSWSRMWLRRKEKVGGLSFQPFEMINVLSLQSLNHCQAWIQIQRFRRSVPMAWTSGVFLHCYIYIFLAVIIIIFF